MADEEKALSKTGLWWEPPSILRYPPAHLARFYQVTDENHGLRNDDSKLTSIYSKAIPNTDKFICIHQKNFYLDQLNTKPFYRLTKDEEGQTPLTGNVLLKVLNPHTSRMTRKCFVGKTPCILKISRNNGHDGSDVIDDGGIGECFAGLIASIFCVGPPVLDFWCTPDPQSDEPGHYLVFYLMERVQTLDEYLRRLSPEEQDIAGNRSLQMAYRMCRYLQLCHPDNHRRNRAVHPESERFCLLDWERVTVDCPSVYLRDHPPLPEVKQKAVVKPVARAVAPTQLAAYKIAQMRAALAGDDDVFDDDDDDDDDDDPKDLRQVAKNVRHAQKRKNPSDPEGPSQYALKPPPAARRRDADAEQLP
jgi:hypothetical protein